MAESKHHKGTPLVLLGIVAITAIVGLVLMFVSTGPTGKGVYGGAIKGIDNPNFEGRTGMTNWNHLGYTGSKDPARVDSQQTSCGKGAFQVSEQLAQSYSDKPAEFDVYQKDDGAGRLYWCVQPLGAMV